MIKSKESKMSQDTNADDILKFVGECAYNLLLLKGIDTPPRVIEAIADELTRQNPTILKIRDEIHSTIVSGDFQFRTPKQMMIDDFMITPDKIKLLKETGIRVFTEDEVNTKMKHANNKENNMLKEKLAAVEDELRIEELKCTHCNDERYKERTKELWEHLNEVHNKNDKLSEENDAWKREILRLKKLLESKKTLVTN